MRKHAVQSCLFILILSVGLFVAFPQTINLSYQNSLEQYAASKEYYDKATSLNSVKNYGPKEEALEKEWNEKALRGFTTLYQQTPNNISRYDSLRFWLSFQIGELQHYFENFTEAVRLYRQAIAIQEKSTLPDSLLFKPYLYAGIIFYNQNKFDTAVQFFKKAESVQAAYHNKLTEAERLYNILGVLFYERGNYKQAQNYFQKALALLPSSNPFYNELFVNYNINLAQIHLRLEEYDKANRIYLDLLPRKINLNEINHNIGSLNLALGSAEKAIRYFRKVTYQNNKIVRLNNSIGEAFFNLLQYDSAQFYYQKSVDAYKALGTNSDPVGYGLVLKNLGDYHLHFKRAAEALLFYQQAIQQFYPSFDKTDVKQNPETFSGVFSYINLFNAMKAKADAWHLIYLTTHQQDAAKEELKTYQSAFKLIAYVERTYDSDEARLFLTKIKYAVHRKPIDIAYELYRTTKDRQYLEALYVFDQQNKAAVLSLNRQWNSNLSETATIFLKKEQELKTEITRLSIRAAQISDSSQLTEIHNRIRDYEIELGKIQENNHATTLSPEGNIPSIHFLQNELLDQKTALLSYHLSADKLTVLSITKKDVSCQQYPLPNDFYDLMQQEIVALKTVSDIAPSTKSQQHYELLLGNISLKDIDQLIIIPDDVLAYFPFESLQDKDGKYLVQSVAIQYQYSTSLLKENKRDFSTAKTLAFAPFAHQTFSDSLPQLPASEEEVIGTNGRYYLDKNATKANFLANSNAYQIIHLATHAVANNSTDKLSYIAFAPTVNQQENILYSQEIYNLRLQEAGLVILSACETGSGELVKGEGILSLSRAFSYAGCQNTITSLWKGSTGKKILKHSSIPILD